MTVVLFQQTPKIFVILKSLGSKDIKIIVGVLYVKYQSQQVTIAVT